MLRQEYVREWEAAGKDSTEAQGPAYALLKTAIEWPIALLLFLVSLPLIVLLALATKVVSPGPAFYSQIRTGRNGRPFKMHKIRSMTHNCEAKTGPMWSSATDKRVTRIGRFMRDTHIDELPQLWNVLKGEMSLIGPRPERPEVVDQIEQALPRYRERLQAKPGLTGLAQVQLPADTSLEDVRHKLAYDLYYVQEMSLLLDLRIALATVLHLAGLVMNSVGRLLVKSYGAEADQRELPKVSLVAEKATPVSVA
jgi:lipopolysaccharide/colanic/teichoic acid biosynthesis glycosyltransferase